MELKYVPKKETKQYRDLFHEAFDYVKNVIDDYSYHFRLIGSAKRNLVLDKPNKGFDFDYQIIFNSSIIGSLSSDELIELKTRFRLTFDDFFTPKGYEFGEDSRSAITIKYMETDKKIHHSYDITLLSPSEDSEDKHISIMRYEDQEKKTMTWNEMGKSVIFSEKYKKIRKAQKWAELRLRYKEKQEKWNGEKKSFSLLMEVVNEMEID